MIPDTGSCQGREVLGGFFSLIVSWKVPQGQALSAMPVSPDALSNLPSCGVRHPRSAPWCPHEQKCKDGDGSNSRNSHTAEATLTATHIITHCFLLNILPKGQAARSCGS